MNLSSVAFSSIKRFKQRKEQFHNLEQIQKWFFLFFLFQKKLYNYPIYKYSSNYTDSWEIQDYSDTLTYIFLLFSLVIHQSKNRDKYISEMKFQYTPFWITPYWYRVLFKDIGGFLMERIEKDSIKDEYPLFLLEQLKSIPLSPLEKELSFELMEVVNHIMDKKRRRCYSLQWLKETWWNEFIFLHSMATCKGLGWIVDKELFLKFPCADWQKIIRN